MTPPTKAQRVSRALKSKQRRQSRSPEDIKRDQSLQNARRRAKQATDGRVSGSKDRRVSGAKDRRVSRGPEARRRRAQDQQNAARLRASQQDAEQTAIQILMNIENDTAHHNQMKNEKAKKKNTTKNKSQNDNGANYNVERKANALAAVRHLLSEIRIVPFRSKHA
mmetsp:Transcript_33310/g.31771  ORF Transcript_33310/g.31771 Transcript_33310/m.31771 type:complete len:166 (+) Transcript_33310:188-685(+)